MEILVKNVTTRTTFEATGETMRLAGTYEKSQSGQMTQLSATAYDQQQNEACRVEGFRSVSGLRYTYSSVADSDLVAVRALVVAVTAAAENNETSAQGGSPALNNAEEQEGGSE